MPTLISFVARLLLVLAGLVLAASLAAVAVLGFALWGVRAGWARLTGKPVSPFIIRMHPRDAFRRAQEQPGREPSRTPRADAVPLVRKADSVTDVEARF